MNYSKMFLGLTIAGTAIVLLAMSPRPSTDDSIISSIKNSYVFTHDLKEDSVDVDSHNGMVTLTGSVLDSSHKMLAQDVAGSTLGVKGVDNEIQSTGDQPTENSDEWIGMQIKASLFYNRDVSGLKTEVDVNNGHVTLKGEADNQGQKDLTTAYAKDVKGVTSVDNQMTIGQQNTQNSQNNSSDQTAQTENSITTKIDDASISAGVKTSFLFHQSTSAFKTGVSTDHGVVTLTGNATSDAAKDMATRVAQGVDGVQRVVNNMNVVNP